MFRTIPTVAGAGTLVLLTATVVAAGCGGGSAGSVSGPGALVIDSTDLAIAEAVYGIAPSVPAGFYQEASAYPDRQTFTVHVKSSDLAPRTDSPDFELCTDDFSEALDWSARNAVAQGFDTQLSGNSQTDWYFQFDRPIESTEPAMLINRVFRCDRLDRSGLSADGDAGVINRRPVTSRDLRWVAEYLWGFSGYNNALNAVIESKGSATLDALTHRIIRAGAQKFAGDNGCDVIEIWTLAYTADPGTGALLVRDEFLRAFQARYASGQAVLCES